MSSTPLCVSDIPLIIEFTTHTISFPFQIADTDRRVSVLYDMLDHQDATNVDEEGLPYTVCQTHPSCLSSPPNSDFFLQIRTVFIIDPQKVIRSLLQYPASVGRDFNEIIR